MSNINKSSISSIISDFADSIENNILKPNETLAESPASFIGSMQSTLGKISAYSYYNTLMAKREIQPSTAILMKSLLRNLKSDDIDKIYATPSSIGFIISYSEADLIRSAIPTEDGRFKLTLNKDTRFYVGNKPTFTLDYNVDIFISTYSIDGKTNTSIYAKYNTDDNEVGNLNTFKLSNSFITTRNDVVKDNVRYFTMYLDVKQYDRNYTSFELSGENKSLVSSFNDELIGFVVLYKGQSSEKYIPVPVYLEGESQTDGVNYSIEENGNKKNIIIKFSKLPEAFNPNNGSIKVVTYTTKGSEGNWRFASDSDESIDNADLNVTFSQDLSDPYQEALVNLVPSGTLKDCAAIGGSNSKTLEEIRSIVTSDISSEYITPSEIQKAAERKGLTSFKFRDDLHSMEYILTSFLNDKSNLVIPTKTIDVSYLYDEIPLNSETNSRMIKPSDVFQYNKDDKIFNFISFDNINSYSDYYDKYKNNQIEQFSYPFFVKVQNGTSIEVNSYDESINYTNSTKMDYMSPIILDKASVISANVYRNPLDLTHKDEYKYLKDFYTISFTINTSSALVTHLKNLSSEEMPYMKIKMILKNKSDSSKYITDLDLSNCLFDEEEKTIYSKIYLETNSAILSPNKIAMINNSLTKLPYDSTPYSFYYIDGEVDMELAIIFKNAEDKTILNKYDEYLTDIEKTDYYYVGIVYSISDIVFSKDMSESINIIPDLKLTQPKYKIANEDIPDVYPSDVYKTDESGYVIEEVVKILPDGSESRTKAYVTTHKAGDIKKEYDGRVGTYDIAKSSWSDDSANDPGIYSDGSVLGYLPIYAMCQWKGFVIFGGEDGRIGCYDIKENIWYPYNTPIIDTKRHPDQTTSDFLKVIKNTGTATGGSTIRGMKIVNSSPNGKPKRDVLMVYGDNGRVASCDLLTNSWRNFDNSTSSSQDAPMWYNNGEAMGKEPIYACETYILNEKLYAVFAGGSGRVCSLNFGDLLWCGFDNEKASTPDLPHNDGSSTDYKAILSVSKYLSILYFSGVEGKISTLDIPTGKFVKLNDGSVIGNSTIYASSVVNGIYIVAGKNGYIASYVISKNTWSTYSQGSGLADNGSNIGGESIYAIIGYDVNVIFAGGEGRICSYNIILNEWTSYDASVGLRNNGAFIKNTISCITFDYNESNIIYFAGKSGNIVYKYHKGDIMYDENNKPIIDVPSKQIGYLKSLPAYSRIYAIESKYNEVIDSYKNLIDKIFTLSYGFPSGCLMYAGVKTTSGQSTAFKFKNLETNVDEYLDDISISLKLGVKFDESVTNVNKSYLVSSIRTKILNHISEIQSISNSTKIEISIDKILNTIKTEVPNIEYFEYYGLNNYSPKELQTIYYDKALNQSIYAEYLSVKNKIDESKSNIDNRQIELTPAIDITIL